MTFIFSKGKFIEEKHIALACLLLYIPFFFGGGLGVFDWGKELSYFEYLQFSLKHYQQLPDFWWTRKTGIYPAVNHSGIFVANPETFQFSIFLPLLWLMGIVPVIKTIIFAHLVLGFYGCLKLSERLNLNAQQSLFFIVGFLIHPFLFQHLAVGYTPWINLIFFPWLLYYWLENSKRGLLAQSAIYSLMLLQGGLHIFLWTFSFFAVLSLIVSVKSKSVGRVIGQAVLVIPVCCLSAMRLVPTFLVYNSLGQLPEPGFDLRTFLFWALVPPSINGSTTRYHEIMGVLPTWDASLYFGLLIPILLFGVFYFAYKKVKGGKVFSDSTTDLGKDLLYVLPLIFLVFIIVSFNNNLVEIASFLPAWLQPQILTSAEKYPYRWSYNSYLAACLFATLLLSKLSKKVGLAIIIFTLIPCAIASYQWAQLASSVPVNYSKTMEKQLTKNVKLPKKKLRHLTIDTRGLSFDSLKNEVSLDLTLPSLAANDLKFLRVEGAAIEKIDLESRKVTLNRFSGSRVRLSLVSWLSLWPKVISTVSWILLLTYMLIRLNRGRFVSNFT